MTEYYCAECDASMEAEDLLEDEFGNAIACPYCETTIPELDPLNGDGDDDD